MVTDCSIILAPHYSRFRVRERVLLTGHSHQAWPDVAWRGQLAALEVAAELVDNKWERAISVADSVREGFRNHLGDPGALVALGNNTHELLIRFLSALNLTRRPRIVTTSGEFHSARRQLRRLGEVGVDLVVVDSDPVETLTARLAAQVTDRTAAVIVSSVLFETGRIVPGLSAVADSCVRHGAELLVDAYHSVGVAPVELEQIPTAWIVGGGYKYLQLGEGNCFLRVPEHALDYRPVVTGWFAEFDRLADPGDGVGYPVGVQRFAGSTYDPTSHFRAVEVFGFFADIGLTPARLREFSQRQVGLLVEQIAALDLPPSVARLDTEVPLASRAGFIALDSPVAGVLAAELAAAGVHVDHRDRSLRLGPAPYLSDAQIKAGVSALGEAVRRVQQPLLSVA